jgi:copper oxidase (laccase) domain-containing protein
VSHPLIAISRTKDGSMLDRHDPTNSEVIKNREEYLARLNIKMDEATRLHTNMLVRATVEHDQDYCRYREVSEDDKGRGMRGDDLVADALVTTHPGHALILPLADCVGAVFFDPEHHVLMLSHLGRHSLEQEGGKKSVEYLRSQYQSDPAKLKVWLTPAPSKESYPIWALDNKGMKEVTFEQLHAAGILPENIIDNQAETDKDPTYFSYSEFLKGNRPEDGDHMIVAMMTR